MEYKFKPITNCNMCSFPAKAHKILGQRMNVAQKLSPRKRIGIATTIVKCSNCGLIYANPLPIPVNFLDHYGVASKEYWKPSYFQPDKNYFQYEINKLKRLIDFKIGLKALDVGAGIGKCMVVLANLGFDCYGLEPSESFYRMAIEKMKIDSSKLKLTSVENADYQCGFFDFITFGGVLEHLYDPSNAINKAVGWLKPGGIIHIEVPSASWLINKMANFYYRITGTDYVANTSPMHRPYHLYEFSLRSFNENAKINNYEVSFYEFYVCETFMPSYLDKVLKPIMKLSNTGMQLGIWLKKRA